VTPPRFRPALLPALANVALLAAATLTRRPVAWLFPRLRRQAPVEASGLDALTPGAPFVLALNHLRDGASGAVVIAALDAIARIDAAAIGRVFMVGGRRTPARSTWLTRRGAAFARWFVGRWRAHLTVIAMEGARTDWGALRAWREVAGERVSVVFPEGIAGDVLGAMRPGVGRWLAALPVATVPCAVWFDGGRWQVRFGAPLAWSPRPSVRDAQLGLALAALLPEPLQGDWRDDLARWRDVRGRERA
jgi:hypothetical protein